MSIKSFSGAALAAMLLMPICGCGFGGAELGQVEGVVILDGEPVPNLSIEFIPSDGRPSLARTDAEGRFKAFYLPKQPGAAPGKHRLASEFVKAGMDDVGIKKPRRRRSGRPKPLVLQPSEIDVVEGETLDLKLELVEQV